MSLGDTEIKLRELQHVEEQNHKDITRMIASRSVTRFELYAGVILIFIATLLT